MNITVPNNENVLTCLKTAWVQAETCSIYVKLTIWIGINLRYVKLNKCSLLLIISFIIYCCWSFVVLFIEITPTIHNRVNQLHQIYEWKSVQFANGVNIIIIIIIIITSK
jgi:hypothetical protein